MNIEKQLVFVLLAVGLLLSSCSNKILFTQQIRTNLYDNNLEVEEVQFYNSKKIVLKRNLSVEETKVARGEIRLENGQYVEEIIFPKDTRGVVVKEGRNTLNVAFEEGDRRNLKFVLNENDLYQISAVSWESNYGKVQYDTLIYYIAPGGDKALLKVSKDNIYNYQKNKRVVKGRSVGQR